MKKLVAFLATTAALAAAAPASAATVTVAITRAGFVPNQTTIRVGDTVTWTNQDTQNHQVISQARADTFASPVLAPNQTFSHTFSRTGRFTITDPLNRDRRMTVTVQAAPASVSIAAARTIVVYGGSVMLSGRISTAQAGQAVQVLAQEYGQPTFTRIADVMTTTDGSWSFAARPTIQTNYQVRWRNATSASVTANVRPRVGFGIVNVRRGLFTTRVTARTPFAGRVVFLQRRTAIGWRTLRRVVLGATSGARFQRRLPRGVSRLRILLPQSQAGPGYLFGVSATRIVRR